MAKAKTATQQTESSDPFAPPPEKKEKVTSLPPSNPLVGWVWFGAAVYLVAVIVKTAYRIRMGAIDEFGPVIHEFDPYFNFRATEVRKHTKMLYSRHTAPYCTALHLHRIHFM